MRWHRYTNHFAMRMAVSYPAFEQQDAPLRQKRWVKTFEMNWQWRFALFAPGDAIVELFDGWVAQNKAFYHTSIHNGTTCTHIYHKGSMHVLKISRVFLQHGFT